jgi:hypothetical protein
MKKIWYPAEMRYHHAPGRPQMQELSLRNSEIRRWDVLGTRREMFGVSHGNRIQANSLIRFGLPHHEVTLKRLKIVCTLGSSLEWLIQCQDVSPHGRLVLW